MEESARIGQFTVRNLVARLRVENGAETLAEGGGRSGQAACFRAWRLPFIRTIGCGYPRLRSCCFAVSSSWSNGWHVVQGKIAAVESSLPVMMLLPSAEN